MKRLLCVALILVSLSSSLLLSSCQKQADVEASLQDQQAAITVAEAEAWFSNTVVKKEKEMLAQTYTVVPEKSSSRLFARMAKLQHKLLWQDAEVVNKQGLQFVVVPVTANKQLKSSEYEMSRAFVFYKNKDNKMSMNVVELMSEKGKTLDGRSADIIATAFYNRMAATKETVAGVNATVFFYNDAYQSQDSYTMRNGVWSSANTNLEITNSATGLKNTESISTEADGCTRWYVVRFNYEDGALVSWEILYSYQECPQGGGGTNTDPMTEDPNGGSSYGQGGSNDDESYYVDEDGDQYRIGAGTYTNIVYNITPSFGGGNCTMTHTLYAKFYRVRSEKDKIISCILVRSDVASNYLGATSTINSYNVANLRTSTVTVTTSGSIVLPNDDTTPFTNTSTISLGSCVWRVIV